MSSIRFLLPILPIVLGCNRNEVATTPLPTPPAVQQPPAPQPRPLDSRPQAPFRIWSPPLPSDAEWAAAEKGDPFTPFARLDIDKLSGPSDALVAVAVEVDGQPRRMQPGYVLPGDDRRSYVVSEDSEAYTSSLADAQKLPEVVARALIGLGANLKTVRLEMVRRYSSPSYIVWAGPKNELPAPLPTETAAEVDMTTGRRLHLVGFQYSPSRTSRDLAPQLSRVVEPVEIIKPTSNVQSRLDGTHPTWRFLVAADADLRIREGLIVDSEGQLVALASWIQKGRATSSPPDKFHYFACYDFRNLSQLLGPHLVHFTTTSRKVGGGIESQVQIQTIEPTNELRNLRLLVATMPLELSPEGRLTDTFVAPPTIFAPHAARRPRKSIEKGAWPNSPQDLQEIALKSTATEQTLFKGAGGFGYEQGSRNPAALTKAWPHLKTYTAPIRLTTVPQFEFYFVQCVFDDPAGKTWVLGPEQAIRLDSIGLSGTPRDPNRL